MQHLYETKVVHGTAVYNVSGVQREHRVKQRDFRSPLVLSLEGLEGTLRCASTSILKNQINQFVVLHAKRI